MRARQVVVDDEDGIGAPDERTREWLVAQSAARVKRPGDAHASPAARDESRQPVIPGEMCMHDVEAMIADETVERVRGAEKRNRILGLVDDRMREVVTSELCLQLVPADVRVMRIDPRRPQRLDLGERRRGRSSPAVAGGEMED